MLTEWAFLGRQELFRRAMLNARGIPLARVMQNLVVFSDIG